MQCQTMKQLGNSFLHILAFDNLNTLHLTSLFPFQRKNKQINKHSKLLGEGKKVIVKLPLNINLGEQPNQICLLQSCCFYFCFLF